MSWMFFRTCVIRNFTRGQVLEFFRALTVIILKQDGGPHNKISYIWTVNKKCGTHLINLLLVMRQQRREMFQNPAVQDNLRLVVGPRHDIPNSAQRSRLPAKITRTSIGIFSIDTKRELYTVTGGVSLNIVCVLSSICLVLFLMSPRWVILCRIGFYLNLLICWSLYFW